MVQRTRRKSRDAVLPSFSVSGSSRKLGADAGRGGAHDKLAFILLVWTPPFFQSTVRNRQL
jgi:hypothetical protein